MIEKHMTYFNILDSFLERQCPVCFLAGRSVHSFFDFFLFENVLDYDINQKLRASRGFCKEHSSQLLSFNDGLAVSIIYETILDDLIKEGNKNTFSKKSMWKETGKCPACEVYSNSEDRYTKAFAMYAVEEEFFKKYEESKGLCLPHFRKVIDKIKDKNTAVKLMETQIKDFAKLRSELKEFVRKSDFRYSKEKWGEEKDSWIRAIVRLVGNAGAKSLRPKEKQEQGFFRLTSARKM